MLNRSANCSEKVTGEVLGETQREVNPRFLPFLGDFSRFMFVVVAVASFLLAFTCFRDVDIHAFWNIGEETSCKNKQFIFHHVKDKKNSDDDL